MFPNQTKKPPAPVFQNAKITGDLGRGLGQNVMQIIEAPYWIESRGYFEVDGMTKIKKEVAFIRCMFKVDLFPFFRF